MVESRDRLRETWRTAGLSDRDADIAVRLGIGSRLAESLMTVAGEYGLSVSRVGAIKAKALALLEGS